MAKASLELIDALRKTSKRVAVKSNYDWKNIGACNCGNLAQVITGMDKKDIHKNGIQKHGDWEMLVYLYRENSKYKIDEVITRMIELGINPEEIVHLENLSDPKILERMPENRKYLKRDNREDVIMYLETWAEMMEEELLKGVKIPDLESITV